MIDLSPTFDYRLLGFVVSLRFRLQLSDQAAAELRQLFRQRRFFRHHVFFRRHHAESSRRRRSLLEIHQSIRARSRRRRRRSRRRRQSRLHILQRSAPMDDVQSQQYSDSAASRPRASQSVSSHQRRFALLHRRRHLAGSQ